MFLAYYYDFWRSCDTEDWSNDAENTALITEINYSLTDIHIENRARIHKDSKNPLRAPNLALKFLARILSLKVIQDQSESNSERGRDKNFYLSEEAGLTPLLAMTQSFEDCDWLVVQEGSKSAFKSRVYYKPSLWNYKA